MLNFVLFVLATIGLSSILVESVIFEPFRQWLKTPNVDVIQFIKSKLLKIIQWLKAPNVGVIQFIKSKLSKIFSCFQCMGFWTGLFCGLILVSFNPFVILCCGFAGSFLSPFASTLINYLEAQTLISMDK